MDWNKSNTILIIAFIVLNIFLFTSSYNNIFSEEYDVTTDEQFMESLENILMKKNITINSEIPKETYTLPTLDTEYEIVNITSGFLQSFLGPGVEPIENVTNYSNEKGETLEIIDGKKLHYTVRENVSGKIENKDIIAEKINNFIKDKKIDETGYSEDYRSIQGDGLLVVYTKHHNNFCLDNSYMNFYLDKEGIYKFEMQNILTIKETAEKTHTFSAAESLPILLSYEDVENKEIVQIEMSYYSVEDGNWQYIFGINSYPAWKVIFSDGTQRHLARFNL